jgi:2-dehydro-3-deoxygalactonokinase
MGAPAFIAGDWGTSHLRLALCDSQGEALVEAEGPGAAAINGAFPETFEQLTRGWRHVHGDLPAVLSGMVGSSFGWIKAPYVACPAGSAEIVTSLTPIPAHGVLIAPGLSCVNPCAVPDLLRGEEAQTLGAMRLEPRLQSGRHVLCLPGTHTKWVVLDDGRVRSFLTAPTGELYSILRRHSVLLQAGAIESPTLPFAQAVRHAQRQAGADVLHLLFECRSRQLLGDVSPIDASAYLSGLLIARDIAGALGFYGHFLRPDTPLVLVGAAHLTHLYAAALRMREVESISLDGRAAARLGAAEIYSLWSQKEPSRV